VSGAEFPQRPGPEAEPLVRVREQSPRNGGLRAEPSEAEKVLMIIKTFLAEILLIKCRIYNIIRSPTSVLISSRQLLN